MDTARRLVGGGFTARQDKLADGNGNDSTGGWGAVKEEDVIGLTVIRSGTGKEAKQAGGAYTSRNFHSSQIYLLV